MTKLDWFQIFMLAASVMTAIFINVDFGALIFLAYCLIALIRSQEVCSMLDLIMCVIVGSVFGAATGTAISWYLNNTVNKQEGFYYGKFKH